MKLYCNRHRLNHHFTAGDAERLIYGMAGHLADIEAEPLEPDMRGESFDLLYHWCPIDELQWALDGEGYREVVDNQVSSRQQASGGAK